MRYYSGFSLENDKTLFSQYLKETDYTVAGFSYGAIKAFERAVDSKNRVDTLQLFSPAFFQESSEKFKRMQLLYFLKDKNSYLKNFMRSSFLPAKVDEKVVLLDANKEDLTRLLYYVWDEERLKKLKDTGVEIEVYLGKDDKIIDAKRAKEFFLPYATTYMINHAGHVLKTN